jgi:hypothetical protein
MVNQVSEANPAYPNHYLSRRRASDVLLEPEVRFAKLFPGHSSVVSKYVYYVGGCDG